MNEKAQIKLLLIRDKRNNYEQQIVFDAVNSFEISVIAMDKFSAATQRVVEMAIDLIVCDLQIEDECVTDFLDSLNRLSTRIIPVIVLANKDQAHQAVAIFRSGAKDFIIKDEKNSYLNRLPLVIERVLQGEARYRENLKKRISTDVILSTISDGMIGVDLNNKVTFANPVAALYLKCQFETMVNQDITEITKNMREISFIIEKGLEAIRTTQQSVELGSHKLTLGDHSEPILVRLKILPVQDDLMHLKGCIILLQDISSNLADNQTTKFSSIQDDLTGLINRRAFAHRLMHTIAYCKRYNVKCAVLLVDLDGFKPINDTLGHGYGDQLLVKVSQRIKSVIREADILARVGGDEFGVLLSNVQQISDAGKVATKINEILQPPFELNRYEYFVTASIGIAVFPNDSIHADQLIQYAEFAIDLAKKHGKNSYEYYHSESNKQAERMIRLANDLRIAIEKEQFVLHFHVQVNIENGQLIGIEALIRWEHPELGLLPPTIFIPIAENNDLIRQIGKWVLEQSCQAYHRIQNLGYEDFVIGVNVSVKELLEKDFVSGVLNIIKKHNVPASCIQFEITESILANDSSLAVKRIQQLKEFGFSIAMDDFGTGYSCLSYLSDLPIDVIKIDRSFVKGLESKLSTRHREIIGTIIELAKRLNINIIAEGVETKEQLSHLKELGCTSMQGFLIAKPMPIDQAVGFIKNQLLTHWRDIVQE